MSTEKETRSEDIVLRISPMHIEGSPLNPRKRFLQSRLLEMAKSVAQHGVIQPIKCRTLEAGSYEVIWGERRLRGAKLVVAGFEDEEGVEFPAQPDLKIPILVEQLDDETVFDLMMVENLEREDLSPSEEGNAYERMRTERGLSVNAIAERLRVSVSRVSRMLLLLELPQADLERVDAQALPQYAALEALRVPADWRGGEARSEALKLAEEAGSRERAHDLIEARYLRPAREGLQWNSDENLQAMETEFGSDILLLSYKDSRDLFPPGVTALTAVTAGMYIEASAAPAAPVVHFKVEETWGDLADKYSAPVYIACDGGMNPRPLVRKDLVAEAARTANTYSCEIVQRLEESSSEFATEVAFVEGDRIALLVMSHDGKLPGGFSKGRPYHVREVVLDKMPVGKCYFKLSESPTGEIAPLKDPGEGSTEHALKLAVLDLSHCPFLPVEGRVGGETRRQESGAESSAIREALHEKAAQAAIMVAELEMAVRAAAAAGAGSDQLLAKSVRFLLVAGLVGMEGNDFPGTHLMLALEKDEEAEGVPPFGSWEEIENRVGIESFCVCSWVLYLLDKFEIPEGGKLKDCPQWKEAAAVYGV